MGRRELSVGLGVLILAAAFVLLAFGQARLGGFGGWDMGGWMMGGPFVSQGNAIAVTSVDAAAERARVVIEVSGGSDLVVAEVMEFSNHFYVLVKEKTTGSGAVELIVERNGFVHPEPGPNMMWNAKYGHMVSAGGWGMMGGRMMGRGYGYGPGPRGNVPTPSEQPITADRAKQLATQTLAQVFPGTAVDEGVGFYGYFTLDVERIGKPVGMLSVNAFTGAVWYHNWHGTFVTEKDF